MFSSKNIYYYIFIKQMFSILKSVDRRIDKNMSLYHIYSTVYDKYWILFFKLKYIRNFYLLGVVK